VGGVDEPEAAVLHVRDVAPGEVQLEQVGVVGGPEEHRLLVEGHAFVAVGEHRVAHRLGLRFLVAARPQQGAPAADDARPQPLGQNGALGRGHDRVGQGQDRRRGAVVLLQADDGGAREPLGESEDVAAGRGPEPVDRLGVVAHDGEPVARWSQGGQDVGLHRVGVLVLVDQHVVEQTGQEAGHPGQRPPAQQQVVVVEQLPRTLAGRVGLERGPHGVGLVGTPGKRPVQDRRELLAGVRHPVVDGGQGGGPRAAPARALAGRLVVQAQVVADQAEQLDDVALVEDGEPGVEAQAPTVQAEDAVGHGVERAAPDLGGGSRVGEAAGPGQHLPGRPPAEREQAHATRVGTAAEQPRHPGGQGAGLARAGPGQDEQRAALVLDGGPLAIIELEHAFERTWCRRRRRG